MGIGQEVTKGERWTFGAAVISNIGQFCLLLAFARLVSREAFAVMAIANATAGLPQVILQTGLGHSLFSRDGSDQKQLSTLFWLHLALALAISGMLLFAAFPIGNFYGGLFLREAIWLLCVSLVFKAIAALYRVLHLKAFNYRFLAGLDIWAFVAGGILALTLALSGAGVFALVAQVVARSVLECLFLFLKGRFLFVPSLQFSLLSVRGNLVFGLNHIGERVSMWLTTQADVLLIGKLLGMETLGVYEVFRRLLSRPPAALGEMMERIVLPLMARYRYRKEVLKQLYLNNLRIMAIVVLPVYFWLAVSAPVILPVAFGDGWAIHSGIFAFMALSVAFSALGHPLDNLLVAAGPIRRLFLWNLAYLPLMMIIILLGASGGLIRVTALMLILVVFVNNPAYYFLFRSVVPIEVKNYLNSIITPLALVLFSCFLPGALLWMFPGVGVWALSSLLFALSYLLLARHFQPTAWKRILRSFN